jgi:hypothetical protein
LRTFWQQAGEHKGTEFLAQNPSGIAAEGSPSKRWPRGIKAGRAAADFATRADRKAA